MSVILLYIVLGLLVSIVGVLSHVIRNLLHKLEIYEDWVGYFRGEVQKVYDHIKRIDDKHWFQDDEDVGQVFNELVRIIDEFNKRIK